MEFTPYDWPRATPQSCKIRAPAAAMGIAYPGGPPFPSSLVTVVTGGMGSSR